MRGRALLGLIASSQQGEALILPRWSSVFNGWMRFFPLQSLAGRWGTLGTQESRWTDIRDWSRNLMKALPDGLPL